MSGTTYHYQLNGQPATPVDWEGLVSLVKQGSLSPQTMVWTEGMANWVPFSSLSHPAPAAMPPQLNQQPQGIAPPQAAAVLAVGQAKARILLQDLKDMDFKQEILPIDGTNLALVTKDMTFWSIALLGVVPLLIITVNNRSMQMTLFALFFAVLWGFLFRNLVLRDNAPWKFLIPSILFTGVIGINLLLWLYQHVLPKAYLDLSNSNNAVISLFGYIGQVGVCEELCKILPVLILLGWKGRSISPITVITIGMFSGLGFAAFENMDYGQMAVGRSYSLAMTYGAHGLQAGVEGAMISVMLRSLSLVFCHAVWSGTFSYFLAIAVATRRRLGALLVVGLGVSAVLHGSYDWFCEVQPTLAAGIAGLSIVLLYGYVSKIRGNTRRVGDHAQEGV